MMNQSRAGDAAGARLTRRPGLAARGLIRGRIDVVCRGRDGREKWRDHVDNLVVNVGLDYLLDAGLAGGTQISSWFLGLKEDAGGQAAGDTMASHAGWAENQAYSEGTRPAWTAGAVSGQSVDNSGAVASFSIDTNGQTIAGAFLADNSTKGGSTGTLYSVGDFSGGVKSVDDGDTLEVTYTFTMADDGV